MGNFKKTKKLIIGALLSLACLSSLTQTTAIAASGNVLFGGNITTNNACFIFVRRGGTLMPSVNGDQLSSKLAGGVSGVADVWTFRNYTVSIDTPAFFIARPAGGDDGVTFSTTYAGQNLFSGINFPEQSGTIPVNTGGGFSATRLDVHVIADRPNVFPAGTYLAQAVVRCE